IIDNSQLDVVAAAEALDRVVGPGRAGPPPARGPGPGPAPAGAQTGGDDHGGGPAERGYTGVLHRFRRDGAVTPVPSPADAGATGTTETEGASA
ncbi:hypothetical protein ACFW9F_11250, partial [Streptomyces sp. NPDC059506]